MVPHSIGLRIKTADKILIANTPIIWGCEKLFLNFTTGPQKAKTTIWRTHGQQVFVPPDGCIGGVGGLISG